MPTDNVHLLPGVCRPDLEGEVPVELALKSALNCGLKDVVVIGRCINGEITAFGSAADIDTSVGLLMRGVNWLATARQGPAPTEDD